MPRPSRADVARQDQYQIERQQDFRSAADAVASALAPLPEIEKIALFGSVARPLFREVPRFQPYRRLGIEILHECKDVDLAVWLTGTGRLRELGRARNLAVSQLFARTGVGVANHQVDVFLLAHADGRYLGRLCKFSDCPKGKRECAAPGCGATGFLRQHEGFELSARAFANAVTLFDRQTGVGSLAVELPLERRIHCSLADNKYNASCERGAHVRYLGGRIHLKADA